MRRRLAVAGVAFTALLLSTASIAAAQPVPEDAYGVGPGVVGAKALPPTGSGQGKESTAPVPALVVGAGAALGLAVLSRRRRNSIGSAR